MTGPPATDDDADDHDAPAFTAPAAPSSAAEGQRDSTSVWRERWENARGPLAFAGAVALTLVLTSGALARGIAFCDGAGRCTYWTFPFLSLQPREAVEAYRGARDGPTLTWDGNGRLIGVQRFVAGQPIEPGVAGAGAAGIERRSLPPLKLGDDVELHLIYGSASDAHALVDALNGKLLAGGAPLAQCFAAADDPRDDIMSRRHLAPVALITLHWSWSWATAPSVNVVNVHDPKRARALEECLRARLQTTPLGMHSTSASVHAELWTMLDIPIVGG